MSTPYYVIILLTIIFKDLSDRRTSQPLDSSPDDLTKPLEPVYCILVSWNSFTPVSLHPLEHHVH